MKNSKRDFLKLGAGVLGGAGVALVSKTANAVPGRCEIATPQQTSGPFYPERDQSDKNNDLTVVKGNARAAKGDRVYIFGKVIDQNCNPVEGARVEIWQAAYTGRYNHSQDPNPAPLDPNFQYWGIDGSDSIGKFSFKTIKPGAYPADNTWTRPPHIHFRVLKRGYKELISQLYFEGESLNDKDLILQSLPRLEKEKVVVKLQSPNPTLIRRYGIEANAKVCRFDITLEKL